MAQYKFTSQRGKNALKDVAVVAGTAEAQSDTLSVNVDVTKWTKGDVLTQLDVVKQKIAAGKWPPI